MILSHTIRRITPSKVAHDFVARTVSLDEMPHMGRAVPELDNPNIRELLLYSYRILYEINGNDVYVLAVIHQRRDFRPEMIER